MTSQSLCSGQSSTIALCYNEGPYDNLGVLDANDV